MASRVMDLLEEALQAASASTATTPPTAAASAAGAITHTAASVIEQLEAQGAALPAMMSLPEPSQSAPAVGSSVHSYTVTVSRPMSEDPRPMTTKMLMPTSAPTSLGPPAASSSFVAHSAATAARHTQQHGPEVDEVSGSSRVIHLSGHTTPSRLQPRFASGAPHQDDELDTRRSASSVRVVPPEGYSHAVATYEASDGREERSRAQAAHRERSVGLMSQSSIADSVPAGDLFGR